MHACDTRPPLRYQDDLEGFVMAYNRVHVLKKDAVIHPYFPLVHVEVKAQVLLFKPAVGSMLGEGEKRAQGDK